MPRRGRKAGPIHIRVNIWHFKNKNLFAYPFFALERQKPYKTAPQKLGKSKSIDP